MFQGRKRFDSIIEQLDFLLSNLEKITETLQGRREMASNDSLEKRSFSFTKEESHHLQSKMQFHNSIGANDVSVVWTCC